MDIKTQFKIGDRVWIIDRVTFKSLEVDIEGIDIKVNAVSQSPVIQYIILTPTGRTMIADRFTFASKADLLASL